jgi:RNA polymerase sigma-70 factor (ECF subfamily)
LAKFLETDQAEVAGRRRTLMAPDKPDPLGGAAARAAFEHFTHRLIVLARCHLDDQLRLKVDPEDVVQSAYKSFLLRYGTHLLAGDAHELWLLLTRITLRKCADRARYHRAERRDAKREAGAASDSSPEPWRETPGREPTPDEAVVLAETVEFLLRDLDTDGRAIIELSLQGYSTQEISEQLGRAERSVRRVRERARGQLERMREEVAGEH